MGNKCSLNLKLQTNATLITNEWIEILSNYQVFMGVSLDGPKEVNDIARVDIHGKSSFDKAIQGIELLMDAANNGLLQRPGMIAVLNPSQENGELYKYFRSLGFKFLNYLLPNYSHDDVPPELSIAAIGDAMIDVFNTWSSLDNPMGHPIAFIENTLNFFQIVNAENFRVNPEVRYNAIIACTTDGYLSVDDNLMCTDWRRSIRSPKLNEINAKDFINGDVYKYVDYGSRTIPDSCKECCYQNLCRGGELPHRYKKEYGFNNRSIYCDALKRYFEHVITYLKSNGYPEHIIEERIKPGYSMFLQEQERVF